MAKLIESAEFFVVGGPVQADRACYVERRADEDLMQTIVDQRFAYVLASRGSGKSSLMVRTIRALRQGGQLAAVVDLTQIAARGETADASRWFYSVAHRICRELRLKVDLQSWWQERSALGAEQRFADFFGEIVLAHTKSQVTIFIDEIERAADLPFAQDFFAVIRDCYALRVSEPAYGRLNFVVLGVASPARLCPDVENSPFAHGDAIELSDFTIDECYGLAPGFELGESTAQGLLDRIYGWTSGQPYLTQKVSRAVSRRGGKLEDVERVVHELFLSPGATHDEPLLNHMRAQLSARSALTRPALQILAKIAKRQPVAGDPASASQEALQLAGVAVMDDSGRLVIKNRIFREVFTDKWARSAMPFNWRGTVAAAAVLVAAVLIPYWYVTYLPQPYIQTLSNPEATYEAAADAYAKLHRLPGFAETAEDLFADVLAARSRTMSTLQGVMEVDAVVRELRDRHRLAEELLGEFWLRRAREAIDVEYRDGALLYAVQALPGKQADAASLVRELVGDDYARLEQSIHLAAAPVGWAVDWSRGTLTVIDQNRRVNAVGLGPATGARTAASQAADTLSALQPVPLSRELSVDSGGSSGEFDLQMILDHPSPSDLTVTLTAPSGASMTLPLSETHRTRDGFTLTSRSPLELEGLADEQRQGVWRLTVIDGKEGDRGVLHRWTLQFGDVSETWFGAPDLGTEIPDPGRTDQVEVSIGRDGRIGVARTARESGVGAVAVWELTDPPALLSDLQTERSAEFVEMTPDANRLIVVSGNSVRLWNIPDSTFTGRIQTQSEFVLPPAISSEGSYIAIAERVDAAPPLYSLIRTEDGELVASVEGSELADAWVLGPEARYLALWSSDRRIAVMDPRRGTVIAELELERAPRRVIPVARDDLLLTIDIAGNVRAWRFAIAADGLTQLEDWRLGTTIDPESIGVSLDASTVAFATAAGNVAVHDLRGERAPLLLRAERPEDPVRLELSPDGAALVTSNGGLVRFWSLENREPGDGRDLEISAIAIGEQGRIAALGFRGGYVRAQSATELAESAAAGPALDFIGHSGPVTAIALNTGRNLIATGGSDSVVRLWNLASVSPSDVSMRHADGPVVAVAIDHTGRWLASAAEGSARVWNIADGSLASEFPVNGVARSLSFSPDGALFGVGDSTGNLFIGSPDGTSPVVTLRADSGVASLAFSYDSMFVATGDDLGNVRIWGTATTAATPLALRFRQAVRWVGFGPGSDALFVQTEQWMHRVQVSPGGLDVIASRLLPVDSEPGAAFTGRPGSPIRLIGGIDVGRVTVGDLSFAEVGPISSSPTDSSALERDWSRVLGLELDSNGIAVPIAAF